MPGRPNLVARSSAQTLPRVTRDVLPYGCDAPRRSGIGMAREACPERLAADHAGPVSAAAIL